MKMKVWTNLFLTNFMSQRKEDDYIEDFKDWQDHQYSPGYFTGARMPQFLKNPPRRLGWIFLGGVIFSILFFIFLFVVAYTSGPNNHVTVDFGDTNNPLTLLFDILSIAFVVGIFILYAWAGINILRKKTKKKK
jgi:uncharacterized integral membrane protein